MSGSGKGVLKAGVERDWLARDPATGAVLPGPVKPS